MLEEKHTIPSFHTNAQIADMNSRVAVIVTHPWGPLGGDMHNNVVVAAVLYFHSIGITTCRFDFAGSQVGRGNAQVTQVQQAASYLLQGKHIPSSNTNNKPPSYILLCGYSYGSLIVASASSLIPQCIGCISIAPPISVQHWLLCFHGKFHANQLDNERPCHVCIFWDPVITLLPNQPFENGSVPFHEKLRRVRY